MPGVSDLPPLEQSGDISNGSKLRGCNGAYEMRFSIEVSTGSCGTDLKNEDRPGVIDTEGAGILKVGDLKAL